jgi:hypothetical protein
MNAPMIRGDNSKLPRSGQRHLLSGSSGLRIGMIRVMVRRMENLYNMVAFSKHAPNTEDQACAC